MGLRPGVGAVRGVVPFKDERAVGVQGDGGNVCAGEGEKPPLEGHDLFGSDAALVEAVRREGAAWALDDLSGYGRTLGAPDVLALGAVANRDTPRLQPFDRYGRRTDWVEFHPAYHRLMALQVAQGIHASPWSDPRPGAHVHRAAGLYLSGQVEAGTSCPISMTYAGAPVLAQASADLRASTRPLAKAA